MENDLLNVSKDIDILEVMIIRIDQYLDGKLSIHSLVSALENLFERLSTLSETDVQTFRRLWGSLEIEFATMLSKGLLNFTSEEMETVIEIATDYRNFAKEQLMKLKSYDYPIYVDILENVKSYDKDLSKQNIEELKNLSSKLCSNDHEWKNRFNSYVTDLEAASQIVDENPDDIEVVNFIDLTLNDIKLETIKKVHEIDLDK